MQELTIEQRSILAKKLEELELELEKSLETSTENARPVELDNPIGRLTRMDAIQQQNMAKAAKEANKLRLRAVKQARVAINEGSYGECSSCGEYIPFARLLARPESSFCVACKEATER